MPRGWLIICLALLTSTAQAAGAPRKPRLMVTGVVAERGIDASLVRLLDELVLTEVTGLKMFETIGDSDVKSIISNDVQQQLLGCDTSGCIAELGGALGADYLLVASLGKVGAAYLLNIKLMNVRSANIVHRFSQPVKGGEEQLIDAVRQAVAEAATAFREATRAQSAATAPASGGGSSATGSSPAAGVTSSGSGSSADAGVARWLWLGSSVVLLGGGGLVLALTPSEAEIRKNEYQKYVNADPATAATRYKAVEDAVQRHNLMIYGGWAAVGLGVVGAGVTAYLFATHDGSSGAVALVPTTGGGVAVWQGGF